MAGTAGTSSRLLGVGLCALWLAAPTLANDTVDAALAADIARIKVIDGHTHADPADASRGAAWQGADPVGAAAYPDVVALDRHSEQWIPAWRALYGYRHRDLQLPHLQELLATKRRMLVELGPAWPTRVLDASGIELAFVNAAHVGAGQEGPRFRWVPFADPLLWPFAGERSLTAFPGGESSIAQLQREAGVAQLPPTLDGYLSQLVEPTLQRWRAAGVPAIKFLAAYYRGLAFSSVPAARASAVYSAIASGQGNSATEQKLLEDFLFREISRRAGVDGLVVQIHTGNGNGPHFNNSQANPGLLEDALGDESLQGTRFVLLHGGWPFTLTTQAMIDNPNVYADFSAQTFYLTTHALSQVLRSWLGWHPEKVLFGTDAYSDANTPLSDYEEKEWLMTDKSRRALAIALTAMLRDREVTRERALEIARMVLRDNAIRLYHLPDAPAGTTPAQ